MKIQFYNSNYRVYVIIQIILIYNLCQKVVITTVNIDSVRGKEMVLFANLRKKKNMKKKNMKMR